MLLNPNEFITALTAAEASAHYALGVSGGRDSMALLVLAAQAQNLAHAPRFSVLTVNHNLRPEAAEEAEFVASVCKKLGLAHITLKADEAIAKTGLQEAARDLRYGLMAQWCKRNDAGALLIAHHLQDQVETILMRLAHHSGIAGLAAMAMRQSLTTTKGDIILLRPFLQNTREELEALVQAADIKWIDDPSNDDMQYERVRWRSLLPLIAEAGLTPQALADFALQCRQASTEINKIATQWLEEYAHYNAYGFFEIERAPFADLSPIVQKRIIESLVQWLGVRPYPPSRSQVENLLAALLETQSGAMTFGGCLLRWQSRHILIGCELAHIDCDNDRRFAAPQNPPAQPKCDLVLAPLGVAGAQILRERNQPLPKIPAAYLHTLPAFFDDDGQFVACPILEGGNSAIRPIEFSDILNKNYL